MTSTTTTSTTNQMPFRKDFFGVEPIKPHLEYINVVLGLSCDDFFDLMWNPANEIWQEIMVLEEMSDYTIVSGSTKSTAKIDLIRQMHAFIGPSEAPQHITLTNDQDAENGFRTRQLFTVTENMPVSDKFDVCERWDVKPISSSQCQVRMSGRAVWKQNHLLKAMITGMVSDSFNKYTKNFLNVMTERSILVENLL